MRMLSGRKTLSELDNAHILTLKEIERINRELKHQNGKIAENGHSQATIYRQLAKLRLDELINDDTINALTTLEQEISDRLEKRDKDYASLDSDVAEAEDALNVIISERQKEQLIADDLIEKIQAQRLSLEEELEKQSHYLDAVADAKRAKKVLVSASEKLHTAKQDYAIKARAYENEALFMYLWRRHYGTAEYEAGKITRHLDGWVAKLCQYDQARSNYWNLLEIPKRLKTHVSNMERQAEASRETLESVKKQAEGDVGISLYEDRLFEQDRKLAGIDKKFADTEQQLHKLLDQEASFANGTDRNMKACLALITKTLERRDIGNLRLESLRTADDRDDHLIEQLDDYKTDRKALEGHASILRKTHAATMNKLSEIEKVRRDFKSHHFDDTRSVFSNESLIRSAINGLIQGVITGVELWLTLQSSRRYRRPFNHKHRPRSPGVTSVNPWRVGRRGGVGQSRRGGFRTGGGF